MGPYYVSDTGPPPCSRYQTRQPRVRSHALTGHRIPAQGANPGNPPGKRNPRSEGTPHRSRVLGLDPALPMRCSFRTHRFCGCGSQGDALGWYAMPIQGIFDDNSFDPVGPTRFRYRTPTACPLTGRPTRFRSRGPLPRVRYRTPTVFPLQDPPTTCPIPCPEGGIAYQPRVPTLGIDPTKKPRVLKERRIGRVSRTSTSLFVVCVANGVNRRRSTSGGCWLTRTHPSCLRGPSTRTGSLGG